MLFRASLAKLIGIKILENPKVNEKLEILEVKVISP